MKHVTPTEAYQIDGEHVMCPNCYVNQDKIDEFEPGIFECENCWQHFSVSAQFLEESKGRVVRRIDSSNKERLNELEDRLEEVERQLGIK